MMLMSATERRAKGRESRGRGKGGHYHAEHASSDIQGRLRVTLYIRRSLRMVREIPGVPHGRRVRGVASKWTGQTAEVSAARK